MTKILDNDGIELRSPMGDLVVTCDVILGDIMFIKNRFFKIFLSCAAFVSTVSAGDHSEDSSGRRSVSRPFLALLARISSYNPFEETNPHLTTRTFQVGQNWVLNLQGLNPEERTALAASKPYQYYQSVLAMLSTFAGENEGAHCFNLTQCFHIDGAINFKKTPLSVVVNTVCLPPIIEGQEGSRSLLSSIVSTTIPIRTIGISFPYSPKKEKEDVFSSNTPFTLVSSREVFQNLPGNGPFLLDLLSRASRLFRGNSSCGLEALRNQWQEERKKRKNNLVEIEYVPNQ